MFGINKLICYDPSWMLHLSEFVWTLRSSVLVVLNIFLLVILVDPTDRSKISSDQKRFFIASSLHPLSFFANTPFKNRFNTIRVKENFSSFKEICSPAILSIPKIFTSYLNLVGDRGICDGKGAYFAFISALKKLNTFSENILKTFLTM